MGEGGGARKRAATFGPMPDLVTRFFFDFVDPLSYMIELALADWEDALGVRVERTGWELRPPPSPLLRVSDPFWADRWAAARDTGRAPELTPPKLVPWTRKAHELLAFAEGRDVGSQVRRGIFEAYFAAGRDIGRIDQLVEIAAAHGLDRTETKAALDVDRHEEDVLAARLRATELGVHELPTILVGGKLVEGFRNLSDLSTLLGGPPVGGR